MFSSPVSFPCIKYAEGLNYSSACFWLLLIPIWRRFWNYGPRDDLGVIVGIQNLESSSVSFWQAKMWRIQTMHTIIISKVLTAHVICPTPIQMLKNKRKWFSAVFARTGSMRNILDFHLLIRSVANESAPHPPYCLNIMFIFPSFCSLPITICKPFSCWTFYVQNSCRHFFTDNARTHFYSANDFLED